MKIGEKVKLKPNAYFKWEFLRGKSIKTVYTFDGIVSILDINYVKLKEFPKHIVSIDEVLFNRLELE